MPNGPIQVGKMAAVVGCGTRWHCPCGPVTVHSSTQAPGAARIAPLQWTNNSRDGRGRQEWFEDGDRGRRDLYSHCCSAAGGRKKPWSRYGSISDANLGNSSSKGASSLLSPHHLEVRASSDAASSSDEGEWDIEEAREAVATVLLEEGLSQVETEEILAGAPVFIRELAGCARELKEEEGGEKSGLLGSAPADEIGASEDRTLQLARHGRGLSPLLESLGVHLPSISKTSRSLATVPPPELLQKVRYFEGLLAVAEPRERPVYGLCQFMLKHLSVSIWDDEDIQRTLTFFERVKERQVGALEETSSTIPVFIEVFPQIFKRNLDQIKSVVRFLEELGVESSKLAKVVLCYPSILMQDPVSDLLQRKRALKKVGIRVENMGKMVVKYPWLLTKCVGNNVDVLAQFLESVKVPISKIDWSITRCPQLLGCSCSGTLEPRVHHMKGYGIPSRRLGRALAQSPELLLHTSEEFDAVVHVLASVGVESHDISKLLRRSPEILGFDIEGTLPKRIKFLMDLGLDRRRLSRIITFFPEILSVSIENSLIPRIKYLRDWGFNQHEICIMVFSFPPVLGYDAEAVLSPKLEFLTQTMKRPVKDVVAYPRYFSYSLEKKIRPRARVLANRQIQCTLRDMLAKSDAQFAADFLGFESMLVTRVKSDQGM